MKKTYIEPKFEVVKLNISSQILAGSGGVERNSDGSLSVSMFGDSSESISEEETY